MIHDKMELRNESSGQIETSWFPGIVLGLVGIIYFTLSN